jgi:class 3 adenylate cyclase/tetratricopeptide (TPR) repeat protein
MRSTSDSSASRAETAYAANQPNHQRSLLRVGLLEISDAGTPNAREIVFVPAPVQDIAPGHQAAGERMTAAACAEPAVMSLFASVQGGALTMMLTDGISFHRFATSVHCPGPTVELPASIAQPLRESAPRRLDVFVSSELDAVDWERTSDGKELLGEKFALCRSVLEAAALGDCGRSTPERPAPTAGITLVASSMPWQALVSYLEQDPSRAPALLVVTSATGSVPPQLLASAQRLGTAVIATRAGQALPEDEAWWQALCQALATGAPVAQAAQRARRLSPLSTLRVYGHGDVVLSTPWRPTARSDDGFRQVTALKYDLVHSTRLAGRIGDERYSDQLARYHDLCARIIRKHGGSAEQARGNDGAVAYFGVPVAYEDSARRAVSAALELVTEVRALGLEARVGVATDRLAIKDGGPVGKVVHLAARLEALGRPGQVIVSNVTRTIVHAAFALRPVEFTLEELQGRLEEFEVPTDSTQWPHLVTGLSASDDREAHNLRLTPFAGRDEELEALMRAWQSTGAGRGSVMLVHGEPGIGKSRLLREARAAIQRCGGDVLVCACRPDWTVSPFYALAESLRTYLQLPPGVGEDMCLQRLEAQMPPALSDADPLAMRLVARLLADRADAPAAQLSANDRQRTLAVLLGWFKCSVAAKPLCVMVDDVQWADPTTREFLAALAALAPDVRMLLVLTQRTGSSPAWPPAIGERLELQGLPAASALALVRHAAGSSALPESLLRRLAVHADGVPLFLEESVRMAVEAGTDASSVADADLEVPATIEDVLRARLDRLDQPAMRVAQLGAVLGREFPQALLLALHDQLDIGKRVVDVDRALNTLHDSGLLLRASGRTHDCLRFKHALVRDVAYHSMWERERRAVHRAAAQIIQSHFSHIARNAPELLAEHLTQAGELDAALAHWEAAGRLAASRSAHCEALAHARRALAMLEQQAPSNARSRAELRLQCLLASRLVATEGYGAHRVENAYLRARDLADTLADSEARRKIGLGLEAYYFMRADFERARALASQAATHPATAGDPMRRLQAQWALANIDYHQGHHAQALAGMDQCLARYRREYHRPGVVQDPAVMCLCYSAWAHWESGDAQEARSRIGRVIELARALQHRFSLAEAFCFAASVHMFCGDHGLALQHADSAAAICEEDGFTVWLAHARIMRGHAWAHLGDVQAGIAEMEQGYRLWISTGAAVTRPFYLALQAETRLLDHQPAAAETMLREALDIIHGNGERYHRAELLRLLGESRLRQATFGGTAALDEAQACFDDALACAREQGKAAFVLRVALSAARLHEARGERKRGESGLRAAMAAMTRSLDGGDMRQAQRWLGLGSEAAATTTTTLADGGEP